MSRSGVFCSEVATMMFSKLTVRTSANMSANSNFRVDGFYSFRLDRRLRAIGTQVWIQYVTWFVICSTGEIICRTQTSSYH